MRPWPLLALLCIVFVSATEARADDALMPKAGADFSGWKADAEVFGWNKSFTEMAAAGLEIKRYPQGKQRGEVFLLVFDIGNPVPKHNVHVLYHTQADMPHDPLPIPDIRERIWGIDHQYQRMWPKRPKRKWFRGAMKVEPIWDFVEIEPGFCQPMVGFILNQRGKRVYQPHVPIRLKAPCELLRMTDYRTYWARKELGACMIRFDYSANPDNEESLRFPLATSWKLAHALEFVVEAAPSAEVTGLVKSLKTYGAVRVQRRDKAADRTVVHYRQGDRWMAYRVAHQLQGALGDPRQSGPNLVIELGSNPGTPTPTEPTKAPAAAYNPTPVDAELERQEMLDAALDER